MSRPLRLEYPGAVYHLTSRGNARQRIFWVDADREWFFRTLAQVVSRYGWICHAYCLMENHYHLLVETPCRVPPGGQVLQSNIPLLLRG
jgi:putative transposase